MIVAIVLLLLLVGFLSLVIVALLHVAHWLFTGWRRAKLLNGAYEVSRQELLAQNYSLGCEVQMHRAKVSMPMNAKSQVH
jgi:hypothetical protein